MADKTSVADDSVGVAIKTISLANPKALSKQSPIADVVVELNKVHLVYNFASPEHQFSFQSVTYSQDNLNVLVGILAKNIVASGWVGPEELRSIDEVTGAINRLSILAVERKEQVETINPKELELIKQDRVRLTKEIQQSLERSLAAKINNPYLTNWLLQRADVQKQLGSVIEQGVEQGLSREKLESGLVGSFRNRVPLIRAMFEAQARKDAGVTNPSADQIRVEQKRIEAVLGQQTLDELRRVDPNWFGEVERVYRQEQQVDKILGSRKTLIDGLVQHISGKTSDATKATQQAYRIKNLIEAGVFYQQSPLAVEKLVRSELGSMRVDSPTPQILMEVEGYRKHTSKRLNDTFATTRFSYNPSFTETNQDVISLADLVNNWQIDPTIDPVVVLSVAYGINVEGLQPSQPEGRLVQRAYQLINEGYGPELLEQIKPVDGEVSETGYNDLVVMFEELLNNPGEFDRKTIDHRVKAAYAKPIDDGRSGGGGAGGKEKPKESLARRLWRRFLETMGLGPEPGLRVRGPGLGRMFGGPRMYGVPRPAWQQGMADVGSSMGRGLGSGMKSALGLMKNLGNGMLDLAKNLGQMARVASMLGVGLSVGWPVILGVVIVFILVILVVVILGSSFVSELAPANDILLTKTVSHESSGQVLANHVAFPGYLDGSGNTVDGYQEFLEKVVYPVRGGEDAHVVFSYSIQDIADVPADVTFVTDTMKITYQDGRDPVTLIENVTPASTLQGGLQPGETKTAGFRWPEEEDSSYIISEPDLFKDAVVDNSIQITVQVQNEQTDSTPQPDITIIKHAYVLIGENVQVPVEEVGGCAPAGGEILQLAYCEQTNFTHCQGHMDAVDIAAPTGTPVIAPHDGVATKVYTTEGGNVIYLDSTDFVGKHATDLYITSGYYTTYSHLQKILVNTGQTIKKGQLIGYTDNTGTATTGPHLHYGYYSAEKNHIRNILPVYGLHEIITPNMVCARTTQ